jgi:HPt (histidine-containing phosphotransfer) domain-containing protein
LTLVASEISVLPTALDAPPIDLDHLDHQTLGSDALKRDVLALFLDHSAEALRQVADAQSPGERREAAHAIVGSARSIGAFRVADAAAEVERGREPIAVMLATLRRELAEVRSEIAALLAE